MNSPTGQPGSTAREGWTFGHHDRCCAVVAPAAPEPPAGSRRRRLWELGSQAHCPVIGVCLPLAAMRRLARKVLGGEPIADNYELHRGMVADCRRRTRMAEAVERELDRRFMLPLRRAAAVKTDAALAAWWQEQGASKDLPGALWATLTHPRCSTAIEHQVLDRRWFGCVAGSWWSRGSRHRCERTCTPCARPSRIWARAKPLLTAMPSVFVDAPSASSLQRALSDIGSSA
jgi:hypothetical protein